MSLQLRILLLASIVIFSNSCSGPDPTSQDILGTWIAEDGASIQFNNKGVFYTKNLHKEKFLPFPEDNPNTYFNEEGKWKLKKEYGNWIIELGFGRSEKMPRGCATQINIGGEGILGNNPPWNLYFWEDEIGGERYEFEKVE